jgi:hypothetical protein
MLRQVNIELSGNIFLPAAGFHFQSVTFCHRLTSKKTANLLSVFAILLTGGYEAQWNCRSLPAFPDGDHFGNVNEMVFDTVSTVETGQLGLLNYPLKIPVITVTQHFRKFTA